MIAYLQSIYYWHRDVLNAMIVSLWISSMICVIAIVIGLAIMRLQEKITVKRIVLLCTSCIYVMALYMLTLGCRVPSDSIRASFELKKHFDLENILLFVPCGVLLAVLMERRSLKAAILSVLISMAIEITQLVTMRGYFELMDIIFNVVGALIGITGYAICKKVGL